MNIDITKVYTTRGGLPVRIYAVDCGGAAPVHYAAQNNDGTWTVFSATENGHISTYCRSQDDLIPAKQWRAWKDGEGPKRFMIRAKNSPNGSCEVLVREGFSYSSERLFADFDWLHEDGTETPCGVCE